MRLSEAVAGRIKKYLYEQNLSQYRFERKIAMSHSTMKSIINTKNNAVNLKTICLICRGLGVTVAEFFDDPIFESTDLEID